MKVTSPWRVYVLGATICLALTICSFHFRDRGGLAFLGWLGLAGIAYLLAIREFLSTANFPRHVVIIGFVLAAVWHVAFLRLSPGPDDDIHRYLWDGRLQQLGYNPYVVIPDDPALDFLHTPETRGLNHADLSTPYPPGAELFFRGVTTIHESTFALKLAFALCECLIVALLADVLRLNRDPNHWVLIFAWNPLLASEVAGSGHIDIVGALLLLLSFAALARHWRAMAALAFGLAVAVKLLPIVLLPLYWKRVRVRDAAMAIIVVGLLYVPFLNHGRIEIGSLGTYVHSFWFNDPVFAALERTAPPEFVAGFAVLVGMVTAIWFRRKSEASSPGAFAWPMTASLLCAPVIYPWYLLWLLPFLRSAFTLPIILWTISILPTYYVWHLRALGKPFIVPDWILLLEYGSVAATATVIGLRRMRRSGRHAALQDGRNDANGLG